MIWCSSREHARADRGGQALRVAVRARTGPSDGIRLENFRIAMLAVSRCGRAARVAAIACRCISDVKRRDRELRGRLAVAADGQILLLAQKIKRLVELHYRYASGVVGVSPQA